MKNFIGKYLDLNIIKLASTLALLFGILFNTPIAINKFELYKVSLYRAILELSKDFLIIYLVNCIMFLGLSINRKLLYIGTIFLFATAAIASFFIFYLKISITSELIYVTFNNDMSSNLEHVSTSLVLWIVFSVCASLYTLNYFSYSMNKGYSSKIIAGFCLFISLYNIVQLKYRSTLAYLPYQYLSSTYTYIENTILKKKTIPELNFDNLNLKLKSSGDDNQIVVLVIGESARYPNFGINDYHRDTTPLLAQRKNLFSFKATSCAAVTYISVPCMISAATHLNPEEGRNLRSFISIFSKLGFHTSWLGTQTLHKYLKKYSNDWTFYNEPDTLMLPGEGNILLPRNCHDELLLPYFDKLLSKEGKQLIILHTSGSHWHYDKRYPERFKKFMPTCDDLGSGNNPAVCPTNSLVNSYDNSILYTDYMLDQVISRLENKNAFLIYASDHGESLGKDGHFMHANSGIEEQYEIPFLVWMSKNFIQGNLDIYDAIKTNVKHNINHDYLFHSILDCNGISGSIVDKTLSICKKRR